MTLNKLTYKSRFKLLDVTNDVALNQPADDDLWFWFKSIFKWFLINTNNRKSFGTPAWLRVRACTLSCVSCALQ